MKFLRTIMNERGAIFIPSVMFEAIRNKIGNIVFLDGNGGPAIRQLITPFNPQSPRQLAIRLIIAQVSQAWRDTLTDTQRTLWTAFGTAFPDVNALGKVVKVSGIAAYMRTNVPLLSLGIARMDDRPANFSVTAVDPTAIAVLTSREISFDYPIGMAVTDYAYLTITPAHSPGRTSVKSLLRLQKDTPEAFTVAAGTIAQEMDVDQATPVVGETFTVTIQVLNSLTGALTEEISTKLLATV